MLTLIMNLRRAFQGFSRWAVEGIKPSWPEDWGFFGVLYRFKHPFCSGCRTMFYLSICFVSVVIYGDLFRLVHV